MIDCCSRCEKFKSTRNYISTEKLVFHPFNPSQMIQRKNLLRVMQVTSKAKAAIIHPLSCLASHMSSPWVYQFTTEIKDSIFFMWCIMFHIEQRLHFIVSSCYIASQCFYDHLHYFKYTCTCCRTIISMRHFIKHVVCIEKITLIIAHKTTIIPNKTE